MTKFVLGDTWREERTADEMELGQFIPDAPRPGAIEYQSVFFIRSYDLTTADQKVDIPIEARFVDVLIDTATGTDRAVIQLGTAIDADALPILPNTAIKIPLQRAKVITLRMASGTGTAYIVANNETFRIWGQ